LHELFSEIYAENFLVLFAGYCQGSAFVETGTVKTVGLAQAFAL
jgi:hypothetical protein